MDDSASRYLAPYHVGVPEWRGRSFPPLSDLFNGDTALVSALGSIFVAIFVASEVGAMTGRMSGALAFMLAIPSAVLISTFLSDARKRPNSRSTTSWGLTVACQGDDYALVAARAINVGLPVQVDPAQRLTEVTVPEGSGVAEVYDALDVMEDVDGVGGDVHGLVMLGEPTPWVVRQRRLDPYLTEAADRASKRARDCLDPMAGAVLDGTSLIEHAGMGWAVPDRLASDLDAAGDVAELRAARAAGALSRPTLDGGPRPSRITS